MDNIRLLNTNFENGYLKYRSFYKMVFPIPEYFRTYLNFMVTCY